MTDKKTVLSPGPQAYVSGPLAQAAGQESARLQRTVALLLAPTLEALGSHAAMQVHHHGAADNGVEGFKPPRRKTDACRSCLTTLKLRL